MKKRMVTIGLGLVLCISMTACGNGTSTSSTTESSASASETDSTDTTVDSSVSSESSESVASTSASAGGVITMEKSNADWITKDDIDSLDKDQGYIVGFTDNFDGNTLHQQQEQYFNDLATAMKDAGIISDYTMVVANNDVATQVQQIESFIMQGCNLIVVDPCSSSGLDGAIEEAYNAGVKVVIFNDGPVSSPYCTQLNVDCVSNFGYLTDWCCKKLEGKGNVLIVRGIAGQSYDELAYQGITEAIAKYPDMKIVGEVYGEYNSTTTQTEVASFLAANNEEIDLVCGESGDAYGAAMAFQAAGRDIPLIYGGNRGEFLNWWMEQDDYETISGVATPWFSAAALYLGIDILDGKENVPKYMYYPMDLITQDTLSNFKGIADTEVATTTHNLEWVRSDLETQDENECKPEMVKD